MPGDQDFFVEFGPFLQSLFGFVFHLIIFSSTCRVEYAELVHRELSLVKWTLSTKPDRTLFVAREVLADPVSLDDLLEDS